MSGSRRSARVAEQNALARLGAFTAMQLKLERWTNEILGRCEGVQVEYAGTCPEDVVCISSLY
jgi:hypothetical protein